MCVRLCQIELFWLIICKQRAMLQIMASEVTAATVQTC